MNESPFEDPFSARLKLKKAEYERVRAEALEEYSQSLRSFDAGDISVLVRAAPEFNSTRITATWRFMGEVFSKDTFVADESLVEQKKQETIGNVRELIARQLVSALKARMFRPRARSAG
jgi:hypothetical protein